MTVRVERLDAHNPSPAALIALRMMSNATDLVIRWWNKPTSLTMSDDWLNDHARYVSKSGRY